MWKSYGDLLRYYWIGGIHLDGGNLKFALAEGGDLINVTFDNLIEFRVSFEDNVWISRPKDKSIESHYTMNSKYIDDYRNRCDPDLLPSVIYHSLFSDPVIVLEVLSEGRPSFSL